MIKITHNKSELIEGIKIDIEDLQSDIRNELNSEEETQRIKLDLESLKTILGHLITMQTF
jgi:Fic family protein